jgi:hypothetical protein
MRQEVPGELLGYTDNLFAECGELLADSLVPYVAVCVKDPGR